MADVRNKLCVNVVLYGGGGGGGGRGIGFQEINAAVFGGCQDVVKINNYMLSLGNSLSYARKGLFAWV